MLVIRSLAAQAIVLALTMLFLNLLLRSRPGRLVDGWQVVEWGVALRGLSIVISAFMLTAAVVLVGAAHGDPVLSVLLTAVVGFSLYAVLFFWRNWIRYREGVLVVSSTWRRRRTLRLSDLQFTGSIGAKGREYEAGDGRCIFINSYQRGAGALVDLISQSAARI